MADSIDDFRELIRKVREGSEDAAREVVERYGNALRRAIRRRLDQRLRSKFDSVDFTQGVWNSFFHSVGDLVQLDSPQDLMNYLLGMAHHKVSNENRRRLEYQEYNVNREQSLEGLEEQHLLQIPSPDPSPVDVAIAHERRDQLLETVLPSCREIVQLKNGGTFLQEHRQQTQGQRTHHPPRPRQVAPDRAHVTP